MSSEREKKMYLIMQAFVSIMIISEIVIEALRCRFDTVLAWGITFLLFLILIGRENELSKEDDDDKDDNS